MISSAELKENTAKELANMAKLKGIPGWHSMRKDELVKALVRQARSDGAKSSRGKASANGKKTARNSNEHAKAAGSTAKNGHSATRPSASPRHPKRIERLHAQMAQSKDLALLGETNGKQAGGYTKDRLVVMVRDPYWLHAYWELTRQTIERARVAMGHHWHVARPVLRLSEVSRDGTTNTARTVVRDIDIHGGVNNWYIDVSDPPKSYQVDIGYVASDDKFFSLCRSNRVTTPQSNPVDEVDGNWANVAQDFDRIYALSGGYVDNGENGDLKNLFEERLHRPMGSPMVTRFGLGAAAPELGRRNLPFEVDADLVVHGVTEPGSHVTIKGEPVRLKPDGSFVVCFRLPDRRQVLPVVTSSCDGVQQRTIVLAIERNTKVMEPVIREADG